LRGELQIEKCKFQIANSETGRPNQIGQTADGADTRGWAVHLVQFYPRVSASSAVFFYYDAHDQYLLQRGLK
jgi:hypothetical protein